MWVWEHALFDRNPKRPDSAKKDKTVEVVPKAALRAAKAEVWREAATLHRQADGNDCKYCLARAAQIEEGE